MASNEELSVLIRDGATEHIPQLWEQVRRFVEMRARKYAQGVPRRCADPEDFTQAGYFAMLEAVRTYSPDRGATFLSHFVWSLRKAFAGVAGVRSTRRDALDYADSIDAPNRSDPEGMSQYEGTPDLHAQDGFFEVETEDYTLTVRRTIVAALESLCSERKRQLILGIYFDGLSLTEAADAAGYSSKQSANQDHKWVLRRLRRSSYANILSELLHGFDELDIYGDGITGVGVQHWKQTGESATERVAGKLITRDRGR